MSQDGQANFKNLAAICKIFEVCLTIWGHYAELYVANSQIFKNCWNKLLRIQKKFKKLGTRHATTDSSSL